MNENVPVYNWEEAVNFIASRCGIEKDTVEQVLESEEDYMRSIGVIVEPITPDA